MTFKVGDKVVAKENTYGSIKPGDKGTVTDFGENAAYITVRWAEVNQVLTMLEREIELASETPTITRQDARNLYIGARNWGVEEFIAELERLGITVEKPPAASKTGHDALLELELGAVFEFPIKGMGPHWLIKLSDTLVYDTELGENVPTPKNFASARAYTDIRIKE